MAAPRIGDALRSFRTTDRRFRRAVYDPYGAHVRRWYLTASPEHGKAAKVDPRWRLASYFQTLKRREEPDLFKALKITRIVGGQRIDAVCCHYGNNVSVVHLLAAYRVAANQ